MTVCDVRWISIPGLFKTATTTVQHFQLKQWLPDKDKVTGFSFVPLYQHNEPNCHFTVTTRS